MTSTEMHKLRYAEITNLRFEDVEESRVKAYLPANYQVVRIMLDLPDGEVMERLLIVGTDVAGWTLEDYVIPRLASGLIFAEEVGS